MWPPPMFKKVLYVTQFEKIICFVINFLLSRYATTFTKFMQTSKYLEIKTN